MGEMPEKPETPQIPEKPETLERPEMSETPQAPVISEKPEKQSKIALYTALVLLLVAVNIYFIALNVRRASKQPTQPAGTSPAGMPNAPEFPLRAGDIIMGLAAFGDDRSFGLTKAQGAKLIPPLKKFAANEERQRKLLDDLVKLLDDRQKKAVQAEDYMKIAREMGSPVEKGTHLLNLIEGKTSGSSFPILMVAHAQEKSPSPGAAATPTPPVAGTPAGKTLPPAGAATPPAPAANTPSAPAPPSPGAATPPAPAATTPSAPAPPSPGAATPTPPGATTPAGQTSPAPGAIISPPPPPGATAPLSSPVPPVPVGEMSSLSIMPMDAFIGIMHKLMTRDRDFLKEPQRKPFAAGISEALKNLEEKTEIAQELSEILTTEQRAAIRTAGIDQIIKGLVAKNMPPSPYSLVPIVVRSLESK
jgi:hypothetical protein